MTAMEGFGGAVVAFDLDGTLVDSAPDLHAAAARMLADFGRPPLAPEVVKSFIGNGVPVLVARIAKASGLDEDPAALNENFRAHYAAAPTALSALYPGVADALAVLAAERRTMTVCTNKPEAPARVVLDDFGIAGRFARIVGGDTLAVRKPDPAHLLAALDGHDPAACLYVGDSEVDAATAEAAGVRFLLFTEGYRKTPVAEIPHFATFSHWDELPNLVRETAGLSA